MKSLWATVGLSGVLCAGVAQAADGVGQTSEALTPAAVIATYCGGADLRCASAPLSYEKTKKLPIAFDFDTGWLPKSGSLGVRFYAKLPAETTVELDGDLRTNWPEAMRLSSLGGRGFLDFAYGLQLGAEAKIDVSVLGIDVKWQGDIPFVPKVDFVMAGSTEFSAWAFDPDGAIASGISPKVQLFEYNILNLVGIPSQVSSGGVKLYVSGEVQATYVTERLRIEEAASGEIDITSSGQEVTRAFPGGAFVEYDVWPEGRVDYEGTLHLIPSFFIKVLTKEFTLPIIDFPVSLNVGSQDFVFDPVRVHVPLPDFEPVTETLDFGYVSVGKSKSLALALSNVGEAKALAQGKVETKVASIYEVSPGELTVESMQEKPVELVFSPEASGDFGTTLTFVTNDPDQPLITVKVKGHGLGPGETPPSKGEAGDSGGCGCRTTPEPVNGSVAWLSLAGLALLRRRRARARGPSVV